MDGWVVHACVLCVCESTATACMCVLVGERVCDEAEWRWDVWAGQGGGLGRGVRGHGG